MRCRGLAVRFSASCLLTALCLAAGVLDAGAQLRDVRTSLLTADDGTTFDVTSAVVRVPEARAASGGDAARTIDLAVVRLRRTGATGLPAAHVFLAGGPGDSGVDQVLGLARRGGALFANLVPGDVIGIDQRGTGRSVPNLASSVLYTLPLDQPGSIAAWLPAVERVSLAEAARLRAAGIGIETYNTRESADDLAEVCKALGLDRVTLWGRSYGSHLALAATARHGAMVDRLVLVSPEGLDHTWKLPSQVDAVLARLETRGAGSSSSRSRRSWSGCGMSRLSSASRTLRAGGPSRSRSVPSTCSGSYRRCSATRGHSSRCRQSSGTCVMATFDGWRRSPSSGASGLACSRR